jgi:Tubulin binding cofactor C
VLDFSDIQRGSCLSLFARSFPNPQLTAPPLNRLDGAAASCESVFLRECTGCTFYLACKQLRTRDCAECTVFLYSKTDPIIETSHHMRFGPFVGSCPQLGAAFRRAQLDPRHNHWQRVFDFNKGQADIPEPHWDILRTCSVGRGRWVGNGGGVGRGLVFCVVVVLIFCPFPRLILSSFSSAAEEEWAPWAVPVEGLAEPENPVPLDAAPAPVEPAGGAGGASVWGSRGGGGGGMMAFDIRTGQAAAEAAMRKHAP